MKVEEATMNDPGVSCSADKPHRWSVGDNVVFALPVNRGRGRYTFGQVADDDEGGPLVGVACLLSLTGGPRRYYFRVPRIFVRMESPDYYCLRSDIN